MKKKIIFVVRALWMGGVEVSLINLLNSLDYDKFDVTCLVLCAELDLAVRINKHCHLIVIDRHRSISFNKKYRFSRLYNLTETPESPSKLHRLFMWTIPIVKYMENKLYIRYIKSFFKQKKFDTAIIYDVYVAEFTIKAIKASKYLMFYHHGAMGHAYHDKIGYKKSDKIVVVSTQLARKMMQANPKYASKIVAIHNIINIDEICMKSLMECPEMENSGCVNIVSCGRLSYEKGMDLAIKACAILSRSNTEFKWWIIGEGREEANLRTLIDRYHLEKYIVLVGQKDNPYPYISRANLFVQTSRAEAYGLTIAEALILGMPIVATETDGAKEILQNGRYGIICEMSPESIALSVERILRNGDELRKCQEMARSVDMRNANTENIERISMLL